MSQKSIILLNLGVRRLLLNSVSNNVTRHAVCSRVQVSSNSAVKKSVSGLCSSVPQNAKVCSQQALTQKTEPLRRYHHTCDDNDVVISKASSDGHMVLVDWNNGKTDCYPAVWLRDNCQCSECFRQSSRSRKFLMKNLDPDIKANKVKVSPEGKTLELEWPDHHVSEFSTDWLSHRAFNTESRKDHRLNNWQRESILWSLKDMSRDQIPSADFPTLLTSDNSLLGWLEKLDQFGLTLVKQVPRTKGQIQKLAERIAFMKPTHYGIYEDTVMSTADPNNLADSNAELGLHTDLPYYDAMPGIQFLHCLLQSPKGGENNLVDGFHVAEEVRKRDPKSFELLTTIPIYFYDVGIDIIPYFKIHNAPVVQLNLSGNPFRINFNNQVRDSFLDVDPQLVQPLYKALCMFHQIAMDQEHKTQIKLNEGEMFVFDNRRVMHGREAFEEKEMGNRHLQTGYMDWDEVRSKIRVLQSKITNNEYSDLFRNKE